MDARKEGEHSAWDCGSPLYDACELASLAQLLDRHLLFIPASGGPTAGAATAAERGEQRKKSVSMKTGTRRQGGYLLTAVSFWRKRWPRSSRAEETTARKK
ncbi:unnamed protein product [Spirodela intermedia]|uniref:Uncharacterized protein n=2 Tax=Spirodela intermedia TaxID=51605 RepID=A0A7I8KIS1_SPIIN|nr:unnamed protein product [Spirodela intermedia]CAA6660544.1 unnamed protein product [Spirodela intermedia]CAA7396895.1 unnamed protein product [Spirodela intermedia]